MGTITLPNFRVTADVTMNTRLKDGGVYIDWAGLSNIKAWLYSDAQKAIAGRCDVSINQTDSTKLVCEYSATKPQYLGVNRLIVQGEYMGRTKTYDKPVFNFVRWTDDQAGEELVIDDPIVDVEISVEDISSSLIERLIAACIKATEEAQEVVDLHRGPRGFSAYEIAVQNGFEGTEEEWLLSLQGKSAYEIAVELGYEGTEEQWIASLKGEDGVPGTTPHIGQNGNWFIGDTDTGVLARGTNGVTPHIGDNGHWFIGDTDTNVVAEGQDGNPGITPHIGANNHWFIGETDTGILAEGTDGVTPDISIGTVTTVEPGEPAAASMTGTPEAPVLNLSIPKGLVGATPNITVGTVTTGQPGTPVVVTITGTPEAPVLNVTIPQGMQGNTGSSVNYPYELVNNLETNDPTKGLSAQQGVVLDGKISQLEHKVIENVNILLASIGEYAFPNGRPSLPWNGAEYSITNNLTDVSNSNTSMVVYEHYGYNATLSPVNNLYVIDSVVVTMGGVDITSTAYSNGVISIADVTGNIVITASAKTYVQSGLVFRLDGKNRGNTTGHWIDDIGNIDFTLTDCTEEDDGVSFNGTSSKGVTNGNLPTLFSEGTIEVVYDASGSGYPTTQPQCILTTSTQLGIAFSLSQHTSGNCYVYAQADNASSASATHLWGFNNVLTKGFVSASYARCFANGVAANDGGESLKVVMGRDSSTKLSIGYRGRSNSENFFKGKILAIRVYSRQLTEAEVLNNYFVDSNRYAV